ncbi:hypothetical protein JOD57_003453 [Geodermatophilus bullaregiensis]|nr:hypothetical protein [Geodermatophilus bullaregiensis]MBM7807616.1 hypothetical protein [Geodermatophilus bullaregiensis]
MVGDGLVRPPVGALLLVPSGLFAEGSGTARRWPTTRSWPG